MFIIFQLEKKITKELVVGVVGLCLLVVTSLMIIFPTLYTMIEYALSGSGSRAAGGEVVTFSYIVSTISDWMSSFSLSKNYIPESRDYFFHHEINYPIGFTVLAVWALGLIDIFRNKLNFKLYLALPFIALCVGLSIILISMNIEPFSTAFTSIIPLADSFRVPSRSFMLVSTSVVFLAVFYLVRIYNDKSSERLANFEPDFSFAIVYITAVFFGILF